MSETDMNSQGQKAKTSQLAIGSLFLFIFGVSLCVMMEGIIDFIQTFIRIIPEELGVFPGPVCLVVSLVLGLVALGRIKKNKRLLVGRGLALTSVIGSIGVFLLLVVFFVSRLYRIPDDIEGHIRVRCQVNMRKLGVTMFIYANDYDDQYPTANKWCDLLVAYSEVSPKELVCKGSDAKIGESSYAFNKNLIGKKPTEVPPDVVVLFETKGGWNQFGGPEILTTENHEGKGCNVLFNDYHVEFVKPERLEELKWEAEEEEESGSGNFRRPGNDGELKYWLENMVLYHQFTSEEISAATGLRDSEIAASLKKFDIRPGNRPKRAKDAPLLVLPYPGGRHPRIGFLDGAVDPQRETKFSVFTPWDVNSYVVVDVPEAIWSNLGLTYLAHTHIDTIWTKQEIDLPRLEWNRHPDGTLDIERKLPNGIVFGVKVRPETRAVRMELWLKNGTDKELSDLRVQNCVMTKMAAGFEQQSNDNKVFTNPYVACRSSDGKRWIITAWESCDRPWGNAKCPCFHSDPKFPDAEPGETHRLRGWLSFYEGTDIEAEFNRIETTGWREK